MKLYLAAQYHQKEEIKKYAEDLRKAGIHVTSSWLDEPHTPTTQMAELSDAFHSKYALQDVMDIEAADRLVFFSIPDTQLFRRGGRHVEFGIAVALRMPILVVGPKENIFHYLDNVKHVATWDEALHILINQAVEAMGL
jgi:hypothetical protein